MSILSSNPKFKTLADVAEAMKELHPKKEAMVVETNPNRKGKPYPYVVSEVSPLYGDEALIYKGAAGKFKIPKAPKL